MHDSRSFVGGDEVRVDHVVGASFFGYRVWVERLVLQADQVPTLHPLDDLWRLFEHSQKRLGQDQVLVAFLDLDVVDFVVDRERDVARERPRGCRPGKDRALGILLQAEPDVDARVGHVIAVALRKLVA